MSKLNHIFKLLLSDTGFVFIAASMASGFSFLTSLLMARVLTSNDYGIYGSCITLFNYTVILSGTIQTSSTRTIAQLKARSGIVGVKHFYWPAFFSLLRVGVVLFVVLAAVSLPVAGFLEISPWLVLVVFSAAILFGPLAMTTGTLQGLQNFRLFSLSLNVATLARLTGSLILAIVGLGVWGAALALPFSIVVSILANIGLVYLAMQRHTEPQIVSQAETEATENELIKHPVRTFFTTSFFALFGMVSFALLTGLDIILVRHFFPTGDTAGHYAAISFLGKAVLYFSAPIALVGLPRLAQIHELGQNVVPTFRRSFWLTIGASLLPVAILAAGSKLILKVFIPNSPIEDLTPLVPLYGLIMLLYGLVTLWIYFFIAIGHNRYMFTVLAAAVLEVGLLFTFHDSLTKIVLILSVPALILWLAGEVELRFYAANYKKKINLSRVSLEQPETYPAVIGAGKEK